MPGATRANVWCGCRINLPNEISQHTHLGLTLTISKDGTVDAIHGPQDHVLNVTQIRTTREHKGARLRNEVKDLLLRGIWSKDSSEAETVPAKPWRDTKTLPNLGGLLAK